MRLPRAVLFAAGLPILGLIGCGDKTPPAPPPKVAEAVPPAPVPPTDQAPICVRPPEKAAFDVVGLKSQLMVTAISCKAEEKYNAFVMKYRPDLVGQEKSLDAFFGRAYGRRAQAQHDDFITQLANAQSQLGIKSGDAFCRQNVNMLDDVMTLKTGTELPQYAASKPIQQALAVQDCPPPAAPAPKPAPAPKKK
jgi:hypothetical protein